MKTSWRTSRTSGSPCTASGWYLLAIAARIRLRSPSDRPPDRARSKLYLRLGQFSPKALELTAQLLRVDEGPLELLLVLGQLPELGNEPVETNGSLDTKDRLRGKLPVIGMPLQHLSHRAQQVLAQELSTNP